MMMNTVEAKNGVSMYYKDWGKGMPVVFSHAWPLTADSWDEQMLFLGQQGFRVIAYDRRGFGRSEQTWDGNDMDTYADDLHALMEKLDLREAVLVGHSAGGGEMRRGGFQMGVPVGSALAGRTLGIVGLGRLGTRVAKYANALGMRVIAWSPDLEDDKAAAAGVRRVDKDALFSQADIVSIHVKLSNTSRGLIASDALGRMKTGALLINTSRGPIIDEATLIGVLREGKINAALDVFDDEPLSENHPFRKIPNVILTPHLGFCVEEAWVKFYPQSIENAIAFLDGKPIRTV